MRGATIIKYVLEIWSINPRRCKETSLIMFNKLMFNLLDIEGEINVLLKPVLSAYFHTFLVVHSMLLLAGAPLKCM